MRISDWSSGVLFRSRIGEVLHRRRPCRGDIDDARVGKRVLKSQSRSPLLRRFLVAALALSTRRIGHRMGFIENDRAVEVRPEPFGDQIGRASCRASVCQYVSLWVGAVYLTKKQK